MLERAQPTRSLLDQEILFQQPAVGPHSVFWLVNWDTGKVLSVSDAYKTIWGRSPDDLYEDASDWLNAIHPDDKRRVAESFFKEAPSGRFAADYRIVGPQGSIRWIRDRGFPIRDASGRTRWVAGIAEDVTQNKDAMEQLQRKHELILNSVGDGIYGLDREGRITFINPAAAAMIGRTGEELVGKRMLDIVPHTKADGTPCTPDDCAIYAPCRDKGLHRVDGEFLQRKDGTTFPISYTSTPILNEGKLLGAVVVFQDATARHRMEQVLAELSRRNEFILTSTAEGICGLDRDGHIMFMNPAAEKLTGWLCDEALGMYVHDFCEHGRPDGSERAKRKCPIYSTLAEGQVHCVDAEAFWRKDGTSFHVEYTSTPIRDEHEQLVGAVVTFRDVTERKKADQALHDMFIEVQELKDRLQAENLYLKEEIKLTKNFEQIVGRSKAIKRVLHNVEQVAATDTTVLITGETGTGKELFARAIHHLSARKDRPLIIVNCAALPATLIESELFGHEKGAFTGASTRKIGRFELAHEGTILLDEVGDLPLDLQSKLLRILQEGEFERVGNPTTVKTDVRVMAATNRDLEKAVNNGEFRMDLYYRLNVFPLAIPPLRERGGDIPLLVRHFTSKFATKLGKSITSVPGDALRELVAYHWPGNVRELENVIERAVVLSSSNALSIKGAFDAKTSREPDAESKDNLEDVEREHIRRVLDKSRWKVSGNNGAAVRLGLNPSTLRSRMHKLGIRRPHHH